MSTKISSTRLLTLLLTLVKIRSTFVRVRCESRILASLQSFMRWAVEEEGEEEEGEGAKRKGG